MIHYLEEVEYHTKHIHQNNKDNNNKLPRNF